MRFIKLSPNVAGIRPCTLCDGKGKLVRIENFANRMLISADLEEHTVQIQKFVDMGFDEIYLHNVGRDQADFIHTFGKEVLPNLKL